ncbi:MAG: tetratricopeptide repeat protein, partial [Balneolaceae bacterium]
RLKGDLDTIILKALEKEPGMRYSSVERMSDDIYRHLSGQPILACKATLRYRMGKFFKRHRRIVVAVCMLVVGLFALNTYHTSQLFEERDIASREAFKAEQINDFMIGLFELANPNLNQGEMLRADEMLEQGINEITSLDSQPEAQIEILYLASEIFRILEQSDKQSSTLHQALDISLQHYGEEHEVTANILNSLGTAYLNLRSFDDSEDYYLRAYDLRKKLLGDNHPSTICSYHNLGLIELNRDNYEKAEYHFRKASEHQNTGCHGIALYNLGQAHYHMGDYHSANKYYTEALEVRLAKYGENHISIAQTLNRLGNNARYLQAYDDALNYFEKSLDIQVNLLGENHDGVARILESKANVYLFLEEYYRAKELYSDAKKIYISNSGEKSIDNARIISNLAIAKLETGNYEEAVSLQEESAILFKDILGNNHIFTAHILTNLGVALNRKGDYGEAVNVLSNSLSTRKDRLPENHWQIGQTMSLLGYSLHHIGETERSKNKLITGYQTILEQQGTGNRFTIEAFERLEKVYPELALEML